MISDKQNETRHLLTQLLVTLILWMQANLNANTGGQ